MAHPHQTLRTCHCTPTRPSLSFPNPQTNKSRLYVNNLEESIKPAALIEALTELFSEYGTILEIVAKTNLKAKGQAFIVFEDVESATKAIEDIQGFELFGKEMRIAYAKTRSDASVKREGGHEELEVHKRRRLAEKGECAFFFFVLSLIVAFPFLAIVWWIYIQYGTECGCG